MVPKEQYGRANGMMSLVEAGPGVLAPMIAGAILALTIQGPFDSFALIMLIDLITFAFAIGTLLIVHVPQPEKTVEGQKEQSNLLKEGWYGFQYIFQRPSLLGLQMIFFFGNLFSGMGFTLFAPMILARTDQNSLIFGSVQTAGAVGGIVGGVLMSAWGGFKRRVHGVLMGWILFGAFFAMFGISSNVTMWVSFGVLLSMTGPSAMSSDSIIANIFGSSFGTGPGAGMGLFMYFTGLVASSVGLIGYFIPNIRNAEDILPDHDELEKAEEPAGKTAELQTGGTAD
jgi:MFS family permease